jgi:hypothetical protein
MPKRYEEEINEILHKFDNDWPPPNERRPRSEPPRGNDTFTAFGRFFESFGPSQLMLAGLALILLGVILRFGGSRGLDIGLGVGGYATILGVLVLFAGYLMAVVRGGSPGFGRSQHMWRGQVVDLRPNNRGLGYWLWRLRANRRKP